MLIRDFLKKKQDEPGFVEFLEEKKFHMKRRGESYLTAIPFSSSPFALIAWNVESSIPRVSCDSPATPTSGCSSSDTSWSSQNSGMCQVTKTTSIVRNFYGNSEKFVVCLPWSATYDEEVK